MDLLDALSNYLSEKFVKLPELYTWEFRLDKKKFPLVGYEKRGSNAYERSRNLRTDLHGEILKNSPFSKDLQIWYVQEWGGVRGNKLSTLEKYLQSDDAELIALNSKGIATWSKILSIREPSKYAIYDARVALALNSLQKKSNVKNAAMFPLLPTQNRKFAQDAAIKIKQSGFFKDNVGNDFYQQYLALLTNATKNLANIEIQDAEMILFSTSKDLCGVWTQ